MTDLFNLRATYKIPPEFGIYEGFLTLRTKDTKGIPFAGHEPHLLGKKVPRIRFDSAGEPLPKEQQPKAYATGGGGEMEESQTFGASVETQFKFKGERRWRATYFKSYVNIVQVTFGTPRSDASMAELRCLKEVGDLIRALESAKTPILMVADTWIGTLAGPVFGGRLVPAAILDAQGTPLWVHPLAVKSKVMAVPFPAAQKTRDLDVPDPVALPPAVAGEPAWYTALAQGYRNGGFEGDALREEVLQARGRALMSSGLAKNPKEAILQARRELADASSQAPGVVTGAPVQTAVVPSLGLDEASSATTGALRKRPKKS